MTSRPGTGLAADDVFVEQLVAMGLGRTDGVEIFAVQTVLCPVLMRSTLLLTMSARCRARYGYSCVLRNPESWGSRGHAYVAPAMPPQPASFFRRKKLAVLSMPESQPSFC